MSAQGYSSREVGKLLSLSEAQVRSFVRAGFLAPARGSRKQLIFSFQDLVLLRTARALLDQSVPARSIRSALKKLREQLPEGQPLTGLALTAEGGRVLVRDGKVTWRPESGQAVFDFSPRMAAPATPAVTPARELETVASARAARSQARPPDTAGLTAEDWYERGYALEAEDLAASERAYRNALVMAPDHEGALVNLGRLLHEHGQLAEAEPLYRRALELDPGDPIAAFNLGVVLEDQDEVDAAISAYARALEHDPRCADAHYNLARLYERKGQQAAAIRHLRTYRKLTD